MKQFSNQNRISRIGEVLRRKQPDLQIMLDDVQSSQNLSAIIRSCDAAGVLNLYYTAICNDTLKVNKTITQGAHRWLRRKYIATDDKVTFVSQKKAEGYQVVVTHLDENAVSFRSMDYIKPTLLIMGNEKEGVSDELLAMADYKIIIPMQGMVQSLNVSVASALILYEAQRQREAKGMYDTPLLDPQELSQIKEAWLYRDIIARRSKGKIKLPEE
ncbi:tRNA (guanine-N2)-dimethyltransferase [Sulfurovum sp. zt1-1]|uniref:tRNA (guanosine(18)-2'-O)-methyltransferase n=1 Tax=Sulfurovum zhangzhouensis TaxID=3019067 RepID=A0ABT7QXS5_9BACT|nr:TrmH family RNA methyltransferase [Sulfurovum zhangzhouensis]MDM5271639.1 tRNA (guanine-N2)-dimethyltransferase [Sulfurovum zhangzhouensis]